MHLSKTRPELVGSDTWMSDGCVSTWGTSTSCGTGKCWQESTSFFGGSLVLINPSLCLAHWEVCDCFKEHVDVRFSHRILFGKSSPNVGVDTVDTNTKKQWNWQQYGNNHTVHGSQNPKEPPFWIYKNLANNGISTTINYLPSTNWHGGISTPIRLKTHWDFFFQLAIVRLQLWPLVGCLGLWGSAIGSWIIPVGW